MQIKYYFKNLYHLGMRGPMFVPPNNPSLYVDGRVIDFYYDHTTEFICGFHVWLFDTYNSANAALYEPLTDGMLTLYRPYACTLDAN